MKKSKADPFAGASAVGSSRDYEKSLIQMGEKRSKFADSLFSWFVRMLIPSLLLLSLVNININNNTRALSDQLDTQVDATYNPAFKTRYADLGKQVILAWYGGYASPVSLAEGVNWPSGNSSTSSEIGIYLPPLDADPELQKTKLAGRLNVYGDRLSLVKSQLNESPVRDAVRTYYEVLTYRGAVNNSEFDITVTISYQDLESGATTPILMGPPTITPASPLAKVKIKTIPDQIPEFSPSQEFKNQVEFWAKAYSTDDRAALKQVAQDQNDVTYVGLTGGWKYVDGSSRLVWNRRVDGKFFAEIEFQVRVPSTRDPSSKDGSAVIQGPLQTQRLDLLVSNPESGLPRVLAWGPVGSYSTLTPGMNSIANEKGAIIPPKAGGAATDEPTAAPSASKEPTTTSKTTSSGEGK